MSKLEFIFLSVTSIVIGDLLIRLIIWCFKRIDISYGELLKKVFSWYVILPSVLSILIASAVLDAFYLQAVPILLLILTAYFHPIAQQPKESAEQLKETERTFEDKLTLSDFMRAFGEAQGMMKKDKSVSLLHLTIVAAVIAIKRKRDDNTRT